MSTFTRLARAIIDATEQAEIHRACARESQRLSREAHALAARLSADLEPILGRLDPGARVIYGGYLWWLEDGTVYCERPLTAGDLEEQDPRRPANPAGRVYLECDRCHVAGWHPAAQVESGMPPHNCGGRWRRTNGARVNLTPSQIDRIAFEASIAADWWPDGEEEEED